MLVPDGAEECASLNGKRPEVRTGHSVLKREAFSTSESLHGSRLLHQTMKSHVNILAVLQVRAGIKCHMTESAVAALEE